MSVKTAGKAVAKQTENTSLANIIDESELLQDSQSAQGFNVDDLAIPRLVVLQSNSPQVTKGEAAFIKGASSGMLYVTGLDAAYPAEADEGEKCLFIPSYFTPSYLEWGLRETANKGLKKDWGANAPAMPTIKDDKNREILPNGNELVRAGLYYGLFMANEDSEPIEVAFALAKTQLKKARGWNMKIQMLRAKVGDKTINPAMFYKAYEISTVPESNDKGNWMGVKIEYGPETLALPSGRDVYRRARSLKDTVESGNVVVKHDEEVVEAEIIDPRGIDEEVPF